MKNIRVIIDNKTEISYNLSDFFECSSSILSDTIDIKKRMDELEISVKDLKLKMVDSISTITSIDNINIIINGIELADNILINDHLLDDNNPIYAAIDQEEVNLEHIKEEKKKKKKNKILN